MLSLVKWHDLRTYTHTQTHIHTHTLLKERVGGWRWEGENGLAHTYTHCQYTVLVRSKNWGGGLTLQSLGMMHS